MIAIIASIILELVSPAPNRQLYKNETKRMELASHIVEAGEQYGIDPILLTVWTFHESSFRTSIKSKSKLKEFGLMQVHGVVKFVCENELDISLSTARGQLMCGAFTIRRYIETCGSLKGALGKYANGRCGYAQKLVSQRLNEADCFRQKYAMDQQTHDFR